MCVPVCVFVSGSVCAWGHRVFILTTDTVALGVHVSVCRGVCVCSVHMVCGHYPLHLSTCAQFSVCLRYVTPCVVHSSMRPVSWHALVWVLRVGACASHVGLRVGLREDACGHM